MFDVTIDPARQLMMVKVSGFWTAETFRNYAAEAAKRSEELRRSGGFRSLLIDMSDYPIQSRDIADMHGRLLQVAQQQYGVTAAVVMQSALSRLQAARVAKLTGNDLFTDPDVALGTLMIRAA